MLTPALNTVADTCWFLVSSLRLLTVLVPASLSTATSFTTN